MAAWTVGLAKALGIHDRWRDSRLHQEVADAPPGRQRLQSPDDTRSNLGSEKWNDLNLRVHINIAEKRVDRCERPRRGGAVRDKPEDEKAFIG